MKSANWLTVGLATAALVVGSALPSFARPAHVVGRYMGSAVNVRSQPTRDAEVKTVAYVGDKIDIADATRDREGYIWYQLKLSDADRGWIREDYVHMTAIGGQFAPASGIINSGNLGGSVNVRSGPSVWYNARFTGIHGDKVQVTQYASGKDGRSWYYVQYEATNPGPSNGGWVASNLVQLLD